MAEPGQDGVGKDDPAIALALSGLPEDFNGFDKIFARTIRPSLIAKEEARIEAAAQARNWTFVGVALGVFGAAAAYAISATLPLVILAGLVGFAIHWFGRRPLNRIAREAKMLIVKPVAAALGLTYTQSLAHPATIEAMHDAKLVPSWDRAAFEDHFAGKRNGTDVELFEAHLEERRQTSDGRGRTRTEWVTVFRGQCLRFDFHKTFYGQTLVARDAGLFNRFSGKRGLERARLEDPTFEKIFEVFTTDQVESRFLLTPDLMQRLVDLEKTFHGQKLRCAFADGEVLLAMEGSDLFEPGSMFTPLDNPDRMRELLNDFATLFHVMDQISIGRAQEESERGNQ